MWFNPGEPVHVATEVPSRLTCSSGQEVVDYVPDLVADLDQPSFGRSNIRNGKAGDAPTPVASPSSRWAQAVANVPEPGGQ